MKAVATPNYLASKIVVTLLGAVETPNIYFSYKPRHPFDGEKQTLPY
jgi:hypothetical protein